MTWGDTLRLAFRNLGQARVRTALTVGGVSIGIASLSGMVSLGVGLQDQLMGRFTKSGMFDSITVMTDLPLGRAGGPAGRRGGRGRAAATPTALATPAPSATPGPSATPTPPPVKLDDEAIRTLSELPSVKAVYPMLRIGVQVKLGEYTEVTTASGVPLAAKEEGAFQSISHGAFFSSETEDACMVSMDYAKRLADEPATLVGKTLTLSYAVSAKNASAPAGEPVAPGLPALGAAGMQLRRVETPCTIVGIVERETGPALGGASMVTGLMLPMPKARAIHNVQITNAQSLLRDQPEARTYPSLSVKVDSTRHTQDVEDKIKALGYSAFSLNDLLQGAKRAFILLDVVLGLIGSIALAVSLLMVVNTMIMSILERTREIGVMKAIGGSDAAIRKIFLIEASTIGFIGGIAGVALGWVLGRVINFGVNIYIEREGGTTGNLFSTPLWLVAGAIGFSMLVSLAAGIFPARRAARLDPIQALRHD